MTRVLSFHAAYGCRESGACCTAGWPIPVETAVLRRAEAAVADGRLAGLPAPPFPRPPGAPADTPAILATMGGACVFHATTGVHRCGLHRALGHATLPLACRQFPRVSVTDPRGVSVTLSHFCPTAAARLDTASSIAIVHGAPAFPADGEYVGLDMRGALPPALRPDMLMDWDSWWQWETEAVALIDTAVAPAEAVARLAMAVEHVRSWTPGTEPLSARVRAAFDAAANTASPTAALGDADDVRAGILEAVPKAFAPQAEAALQRTVPRVSPRAHLAFLAAHAFASWTAHLGDDLRTWWHSLETAHVLLDAGVGVREADLLLRHLADPHALARAWGSPKKKG